MESSKSKKMAPPMSFSTSGAASSPSKENTHVKLVMQGGEDTINTSSSSPNKNIDSKHNHNHHHHHHAGSVITPRNIFERLHLSSFKKPTTHSSGRADRDYSVSFTSASKNKNADSAMPSAHHHSGRSGKRSSYSTSSGRRTSAALSGSKRSSRVAQHKLDETVEDMKISDNTLGLASEHDSESYEDSKKTLSEMSDRVIETFADNLLKNGLTFIDALQSHLNNPQEDRLDDDDQEEEQGLSSRTKTIRILHETLSPALDLYESFASGLIERGEKEHKRQMELRRHLKRMEGEKKEWKKEREEVVKSLSTTKKREKDLKEEIHKMDDQMAMAQKKVSDAQAELDIVMDADIKERKQIQKELLSKDNRIDELESMVEAKDEELEKAKKNWQVCVLCQNLLQLPQSVNVQKDLAVPRDSFSRESAKTRQIMPELKDDLNIAQTRIEELERHLKLREAQLEESKKEWEMATERAAAKDKDMSELMKTIGSIQRAGEAREAEAHKLQKKAEEKAESLESSLVALKAEHSTCEASIEKVHEKTEHYKKELLNAEEFILELKGREKLYKSDLNMAGAQLKVEKGLRARSEQKEQEERTERIAMSAQMMAMAKDYAKMEAQLAEADEVTKRKWSDKMTEQKQLYEERENELREARHAIAGLEAEIQSLKQALHDHETGAIPSQDQTEEISRLKGEIIAAKEKLKFEEEHFMSVEMKYEQTVKELEEEIEEGEAERRRLHNIIQDLRGNVRVFARIRPFLPEDNCGDDPAPCVVQKIDKEIKLRLGEEEPWHHNFSFDQVFPPTSGQDNVFREAKEFIQSALDGYNVCLFSYGQTGSGKTHTMQGSGMGQMRGIIPRAIEEVGMTKTKLERDGWEYDMEVSYLEIYNEKIRDLLRDDHYEEVKHEVKVNKDGKRYVSGITMKHMDPNDRDAVESVMRQAAMCRSVASTGMNAVSSRSHAVFTLHLTAIHSEKGQALRGQLNLVDLAGSERLHRSNAAGDRARETKSINKSLSSLTDVFVAIGNKAGHIPYRNSKLTYLLQPCLGGEGKTLMLVNLSPTEASSQESLCSLRFASHVNKCELGQAKRSIEEYEDDDVRSAASASTSSRRGGSRMISRKPVGDAGSVASRSGSRSVASLGGSRSAASLSGSRSVASRGGARSGTSRGDARSVASYGGARSAVSRSGARSVSSHIPSPTRVGPRMSKTGIQSPSRGTRTTSSVSPRKAPLRRLSSSNFSTLSKDEDELSIGSNISSISGLSRSSRSTISTVGTPIPVSPTRRQLPRNMVSPQKSTLSPKRQPLSPPRINSTIATERRRKTTPTPSQRTKPPF